MSIATAPVRPTLVSPDRLCHAVESARSRFSLAVVPHPEWRAYLARLQGEEWFAVQHEQWEQGAGRRWVVSCVSTLAPEKNVSLPLTPQQAARWIRTMARGRSRAEIQTSKVFGQLLG